MGGDRLPGPIGSASAIDGEPLDDGGVVTGAGSADLRVLGQGADPMTDRIIASVTKDWDPPSPFTDSWVTVSGDTLADVEAALQANDEWGKGGGSLRSDRIPVGTSTNLTINLHANLELRVAVWSDYRHASIAAKREWDRMIVKLTAHEQRHVDIAIEEFDRVATDLVGEDIDRIAPMVTAANATVARRQRQLDSDTDHGRRAGVAYGDVSLDTSIV